MRTPALLACLAAALAGGCAPRGDCGGVLGRAPVYDLLVRGGSVVDGTGSPWFRGDVLVCGDRIAAVGVLPGARARDTLDATGMVVAPGFIDMLGQSEYTLLRDGRAVSKVTQGITSEITGEVTSVVPVNEATLRGLGPADRERTRWTDLDGYFRELERSGTAINVGTFVAVGSLRQYVMGGADRAPTPAELARMKGLVSEAMEQGAMGVSAALIYPPASSAGPEELAALAGVAASYGGGYATHLRSEGDRLLEALDEAISVGERSGAWVQVHHLKAAGHRNWDKVGEALARIERARARRVDVAADQYPYAASSTGLATVLPDWANAGGTDSLLARLARPAVRDTLRAYLRARWADWHAGADSTGPGSVRIAGVQDPMLEEYVGRRLSEVARERGMAPEDLFLEMVRLDGGRTSATFFSMSEAGVDEIMRRPWVSVGVDAGATVPRPGNSFRPHPRTFGTFPRILCRYVRERGVLPLEEAVRKFTSLPAARVGLDDRGVLKAGLHADLVVFDPSTVCDHATFQEPAQLSTGVRHVVVNGAPVLRGGVLTGALPGRGLRRGRGVPRP